MSSTTTTFRIVWPETIVARWRSGNQTQHETATWADAAHMSREANVDWSAACLRDNGGADGARRYFGLDYEVPEPPQPDEYADNGDEQVAAWNEWHDGLDAAVKAWLDTDDGRLAWIVNGDGADKRTARVWRLGDVDPAALPGDVVAHLLRTGAIEHA